MVLHPAHTKGSVRRPIAVEAQQDHAIGGLRAHAGRLRGVARGEDFAVWLTPGHYGHCR